MTDIVLPDVGLLSRAASTGDYSAGYALRAWRWWRGGSVDAVDVGAYAACAGMTWGQLLRAWHTAVCVDASGAADIPWAAFMPGADEYAALVVMTERVAVAALARDVRRRGSMRIGGITGAVRIGDTAAVAPVDVRAMVPCWSYAYHTGDYAARYVYRVWGVLTGEYGRDWGARPLFAACIPWVAWLRVRDLPYGALLRLVSPMCTPAGWVAGWEMDAYAALVVMIDRIAARACWLHGGCDENN